MPSRHGYDHADALTARGLAWAIANADDSITARIALADDPSWPASHRRAAIASCNSAGERDAT